MVEIDENDPTSFMQAIPDENGSIRTDGIGADNWAAYIGESVAGIWTVEFDPFVNALSDEAADVFGTTSTGDTIRKMIEDEKIVDILFVVEYSGTQAAWPTSLQLEKKNK